MSFLSSKPLTAASAMPFAIGTAPQSPLGLLQCNRHPGQLDLDALASDWRASAVTAPSTSAQATQRSFDLVLSLAGLVLTLPLLLLVVVLVKLDSPGPAFYRQERVGLSGRTFSLIKFRSMRVDAEVAGPCWASERDPRVTRLGRLLRLTRIDELPQLLNVLAGSMSLVGPRPERPHFVGQLTQVIPHFTDRIAVKPGLTGWAQVNYPYGASVEDARQKLAYDLYYIQHRSLSLDLRILLATIRVVLCGSGAR